MCKATSYTDCQVFVDYPKSGSRLNLPLIFFASALECAHFSFNTDNRESRVIVGASLPRYGDFQVSKHESKHANDTQHICVALDKIYGSVKASILTPPPILQKVANDNIPMQRLESKQLHDFTFPLSTQQHSCSGQSAKPSTWSH